MHALIGYTFGIKQLIVVINKMDYFGAKYSQNRFDEIKGEIGTFLKKIGYK